MLAVIIILVLELKPPRSPNVEAFVALWPTAVSYAVSYFLITIGNLCDGRRCCTYVPKLICLCLLFISDQRRQGSARDRSDADRAGLLTNGHEGPSIAWPRNQSSGFVKWG
jgi:hypothetical protein